MASAAVENPQTEKLPKAESENPQAEEVAKVKDVFAGRCRVIKDIGVFTHVVTLQPQDMDVTLKFQLQDSYPSTVPQISVRSESLTHDDNQDLVTMLTTQGGELLGQPMLVKLVNSAEKWLKKQGVKPGKSVNANTETFLTGNGKPKARKQRSRKKNKEEAEEEGKKSSMKTSDDVIKRILWDDKLDKDDFLVGYLDRFKGIQEKYFSAFSWEDIATVDYDVLAVPKHRIQYFKYRKEKIWDKPSRMDNVFGSTGSGKTVYDVMENYQEQPESTDTTNGASQSAGTTTHTHNDDSGSDGDYDDSSDDDDGITVTIGTSVNTVAPTEKRETSAKEGREEEEEEEVQSSAHDPFWQDKMRPNYFLAVRITDPEIRQGIEQVQDYILDNEPLYGPCCIPPAALHVTLCTVGLDTAQAVADAKSILERLRPEIESARPKKPIRLEGVTNFYNRVVYAKVEHNPELLEFVNYVRLLVREAGIEIRDNHEFVPHMTIMKVTRPVARQKGSKNVAPWLYSCFEDMLFGQQKVDALYLCSMGNERRSDGFYLTPSEIHFSE